MSNKQTGARKQQTMLIKDPVILRELNNKQRFSPSEIEAYLTCPYCWFIERYLGLFNPEVSLGPRERGTYRHALLERVGRWCIAGNHSAMKGVVNPVAQNADCGAGAPDDGHPIEITSENISEITALIDRVAPAVQQDLIDTFFEGASLTRQDQETLERDTELIKQYLKQEIDWLPGFNPAFVELGFTVELKSGERVLGIEVPQGFTISGKIDRIDIKANKDGSIDLVIIDYKSGRSGATPYTDKELSYRQVQTALYAALLSDQQTRAQILNIQNLALNPWAHQLISDATDLRVVGALYVSLSSEDVGGMIDSKAVSLVAWDASGKREKAYSKIAFPQEPQGESSESQEGKPKEVSGEPQQTASQTAPHIIEKNQAQTFISIIGERTSLDPANTREIANFNDYIRACFERSLGAVNRIRSGVITPDLEFADKTHLNGIAAQTCQRRAAYCDNHAE